MAVRAASRSEALRLLDLAERRHGYPMSIDLDEYSEGRSGPANAYLFGVCYPLIAGAKGYDTADIHEWMCGQFFGWRDESCPKTPHNPQGVRSVPIRSTTRNADGKRNVVDVETFSRFIDMVHRVGAAAGVFIPDPEPSVMRQSKHTTRTTPGTRKAAA